MATKTEDRKIYEPEYYEETPLPESVIWEEIIDAPKSVADLNPADGAALAAATIAIDGLGALAYEDLVTELQLASNAVTTAKIAVNAITADVIAANAITTVKISDNAIEAAKIAAGAVVAGKLAANSVVASNIQAGVISADKMNVSTLSAITANLGTVTAGSINGLTITGGTIRTASSGTRVQLDSSSNELQIYSGSTKRARGYDQGWDYYNSSGTLKGSIYVSSNDMLIAADLTSTGNLYYGVGSSGSHSFHVGTGASTIRQYIDDTQMWLGDVDNFNFKIEVFGLAEFYNEKGILLPTVGRVSSGGVLSGAGSGWSASNDSTGVYTITHNIGSSAYSVVAVVEASSGDYKCKIGSRGSNSFTVRVDQTGTLANAAFNFILIYY